MVDNNITINESFIVVLDSRNATNYLNGTFNSSVLFNFYNPIRVKNNSVSMSCGLSSFSCPNSIYNINETNSLLSLTVNSITTNYDIMYGTYDVNTFMTQLISQIGSNFTISLNNITNKLTLVNSLYNFSINSNSTIYNIMGFTSLISISSTNKTLIMPYMCNFNGLASLNIVIQNFNMNNLSSYNQSDTPIIQSVSINPVSSIITYNKSNDFKFIINDATLTYLQIDIMDDLENLINFNNQYFNLTLEFTEIINIDKYHYVETFDSILKNGYNK